jgi:hypothetical protein
VLTDLTVKRCVEEVPSPLDEESQKKVVGGRFHVLKMTDGSYLCG